MLTHPSSQLDIERPRRVAALFNIKLVRMADKAVSNANKCGNYQAYCEEVDAMARILGITGEQVEEMMMSKGGHNPWPWRAHVRANWPAHAPANPYKRLAMHAIYPHIPLGCF